jgi:ChrR-like protein with cupin domain
MGPQPQLDMVSMQLNADFSRRVAVHAAELPWTPSPIAGVERRMLDRVGGEVARATSLVRYAPNSHFSPHTHDGGEEFLVLEGVFSDEHGDFPAGCYIRNPPTSRHTPGSKLGCTIFVKLWQFALHDRTEVRINTNIEPFTGSPEEAGVDLMPLFKDEREEVRLEHWAPHTEIDRLLPGGVEVLLLAGGLTESGEAFRAQSWLRLPARARLRATTAATGCRLWVKLGHLARAQTGPPPGG